MSKFPMKLENAVGSHEQDLAVHIARPDEAQEVYEFLLHHFFPQAPIRQLGLYDESEEAKRPAWIEELVRDCLRTPHSLLVRDSRLHNQIVAVAVNEMKSCSIAEKPAPTDEPNGNSRSSSDPAQIPVGRLHKAVLKEIHQHVDMFNIYETDKKMEFSIAAVDERYSRQGLASKLMELALEIAKEAGAGVIWTEALSAYTAKVANKFGFDTLKSIDYSEFRFEGYTPLANIPGHRTGHLMARKI